MSLLAFQWAVFKFSLISGVALGALYGILAISLVLTFRMSRVVGFVHGGISCCQRSSTGISPPTPANVGGWRRRLGLRHAGVAEVARNGARRGVRDVRRLRLRLGRDRAHGDMAPGDPHDVLARRDAAARRDHREHLEGAFEIVPSPFGQGRTRVLGYVLSHHQIAVVIILIVVVLVLNFVVTRTDTGVQLRGIADDIEAAEMVGVPVRLVSLAVWAVAGALAGMSGILLTPMTRLGASTVLFVLLRSMAGAALGGFESLTLALLGAMIFGQIESHVQGGTFGTISSGWREVILMTVLFAGVLAVTRCERPASRAKGSWRDQAVRGVGA